jgi:hypothetical protein
MGCFRFLQCFKAVRGRQTLVLLETPEGWKIVHEYGTIRRWGLAGSVKETQRECLGTPPDGLTGASTTEKSPAKT